MNDRTDFRAMTADTIGKDLLQALVQELKLMPDTWPKLSKTKQDDIIDRLRDRVANNIRMAVHLLASEGRTVVTGDLDQITIKDGAKAVIKIGRSAESLHELYDAADKAVLIVVSDVGGHLGGMDGVTGEADQRGLDLGHEYRDDDGGGMDDSNVIDAAPALPAPDDDDQPTDAELDAAYEEGYQAAADGKPESDCPAADGQICIAWVKGWKDWHDNEASAA